MYPKEYVQYLVHFHGDRDYFECHEILEDYWKQTDPGNKASVWVGLIQVAVSCYHHRRDNFKGAKRTLEKAVSIFFSQEQLLLSLGLNTELFSNLLKERLTMIEEEKPYHSFNLPISDPILLEACLKLSKQIGFLWGSASDMTNVNVVHRHKLRDRTSMIKEREQLLTEKKTTNN